MAALSSTCSSRSPGLQRGLRDVLASTWLRRRLALLAAAWFAAGAGYYGLVLLAEGMSGGSSTGGGGGGSSSGSSDDSVYITLLVGFAYEVPGIAAAGLAVERAGRKATGVAAFLQGGLGCWWLLCCTGWAGAWLMSLR